MNTHREPRRRPDQRLNTLLTYHGRQGVRWLRLRMGGGARRHMPVFVLGLQRSGTNMAMRVLGNSPDVMLFNEHPLSLAFRNYRIRSNAITRRLVAGTAADAVVFKPLCDAQWGDRLLDSHTGSRALWIYRAYTDVANSAVAKWATHQKDIVRAFAKGDVRDLGWRGERYQPADQELARTLYRDDMTGAEAGCAYWALRNSLPLRLGLDNDPRVLFVRYSDLVSAPDVAFARVFQHLGLHYDARFGSDVHARSVGRAAPAELSDAVQGACEDVWARLDAARERQP